MHRVSGVGVVEDAKTSSDPVVIRYIGIRDALADAVDLDPRAALITRAAVGVGLAVGTRVHTGGLAALTATALAVVPALRDHIGLGASNLLGIEVGLRRVFRLAEVFGVQCRITIGKPLGGPRVQLAPARR